MLGAAFGVFDQAPEDDEVAVGGCVPIWGGDVGGGCVRTWWNLWEGGDAC